MLVVSVSFFGVGVERRLPGVWAALGERALSTPQEHVPSKAEQQKQLWGAVGSLLPWQWGWTAPMAEIKHRKLWGVVVMTEEETLPWLSNMPLGSGACWLPSCDWHDKGLSADKKRCCSLAGVGGEKDDRHPKSEASQSMQEWPSSTDGQGGLEGKSWSE